MNEIELKHLKDTLIKGRSNSTDVIWIKAFATYNLAQKGMRMLGMGCGVCYKKVYDYHLTQIK